VIKGVLHVAGRLVVDRNTSQKEAERAFGSSNLWRAKDHILVAPDVATDINDIAVPTETVTEQAKLARVKKIVVLV
jgi:hypothetical protein